MKKTIALGVLALILTACGDKPVPEHGTVTDANYTPAGVTIIPAQPPICSGQPMTCTGGMPMQIIPYPEEWRLEITDLNNKDWVGTVAVDQTVYEHCNLGELWPDCSVWGAGDTRPE